MFLNWHLAYKLICRAISTQLEKVLVSLNWQTTIKLKNHKQTGQKIVIIKSTI